MSPKDREVLEGSDGAETGGASQDRTGQRATRSDRAPQGIKSQARPGVGKPNGSCESLERIRRCRPGTSTRLWEPAVRQAFIAAERKAASRIKLLPERSADAHRSDDPKPGNSGVGERRAYVPAFRMPRSDRACRSGSKLPDGSLGTIFYLRRAFSATSPLIDIRGSVSGYGPHPRTPNRARQ